MNFRNKIKDLTKSITTITSNTGIQMPVFLSIDVKGNLVIDGGGKLLDYTSNRIEVSAKIKNVIVVGEDLTIVAFDKENIRINGKISRIEFSEVQQ